MYCCDAANSFPTCSFSASAKLGMPRLYRAPSGLWAGTFQPSCTGDVPSDVRDVRRQVRAALDSLPPRLAAALTNVAVVVDDENPGDPDLFGLYEGVPLPE